MDQASTALEMASRLSSYAAIQDQVEISRRGLSSLVSLVGDALAR